MNTTRRTWLASLALGVATLKATAGAMTGIIDTHTHFYDPTRPQGVPWPGKTDAVLYRKVLPDEYRKLAEPLGITGTVVVEASPWVEDNQWLLDLAKDEPFLVGVVGNLAPTDQDFAKNLERFAKNAKFRGIRIGHDTLKKALQEPAVLQNLGLLAERDLALDVNGGPDLLLSIAPLAEKLPKLRIVINHMANQQVDGKAPPQAYRKNLKAAAQANVWCKLSAWVDATRKRGTAPDDLNFYRPVVDAVWDAFGAEKLLFGTNWPVSDLYAKVAVPVELAKKYLAEKGEKATTSVSRTNAIKAYGLKL